jgi:prepilin-type N-terminal cleavage/methylation domain-containing protein
MKASRGFTIIELLIVMAIIVIFPAIVVSNFFRIERQFNLSRVAYGFAQDVRTAQNKTLAFIPYKNINDQVVVVGGYGIYVNIPSLGNKKYLMYADYALPNESGNHRYDALDYVASSIDISSREPGVIIKAITNIAGSDTSINFDAANQNIKIANLAANNQNIDVVFALEDDPTITRTVSINTSGLIEVK